MKSLLTIQFDNTALVTETGLSSNFLQDFIIDAIKAEGRLASIDEYIEERDNVCEFSNDTDTANVILELAIDIPEHIRETNFQEEVFDYIISQLSKMPLRYLEDWYCGKDHYISLEMDENNPAVNYDYSEIDM